MSLRLRRAQRRARNEDKRAGGVVALPRPLSAALIVALCVLLSSLMAGCGEKDEANGEQEGIQGDDSAAVVDHDWGEPGGRWHAGNWAEVSPDEAEELTPEQIEAFQRLLSVGYVSGSQPVPLNEGVVVYDGSKTYYGLNLYTSGHMPGAVLMDMSGGVLHVWKKEFLDAWNEMPGEEPPRSIKSGGFWRRVHLFENGDVIGIYDWIGMVKLDEDSNLLWANFQGFHHDLEVLDDGRIISLVREAHIVQRIHPELPILEDYIVVLDENGNELSRVSLLEAIEASEYTWLLSRLADHGDIFHTNTVEVLDGRLADRIPGFEAGNVLVTIREIGCIAVVDLDEGKVVWALDGHWRKPHQATVLESGNIMIFDNRGNRGRSQVIEFDPVELRGAWIYRGEEPDDFYSDQCGSNQRLPNGNTLITETDRGKAFEVTPDGEIVWKYINPAHAIKKSGGEREYIASVFEMIRLPPDFPTDWLDTDEEARREAAKWVASW